MTIPSTNFGLSHIQTEFGGSVPTSLSEYYRGGARVPADTPTSSVDGSPISTSGLIRMGMFRNVTVPPSEINLTISSHTAHYDIRSAAGNPSGAVTVNLTINPDTTVYGNTAFSPTPALDTGSGWASGTIINITNNGYVIGGGGQNDAIDNSGSGGSLAAGLSGRRGGHAFRAQGVTVNFINNGVVAAGGGSGGYGGNGSSTGGANGYGGAGGAGRGGLFSAPSTAGGTPIFSSNGSAATAGSASGGTGSKAADPGNPGNAPAASNMSAGGGAGGGWGARGGTGGSGRNGAALANNGGLGGDSGDYLNGASTVTWSGTGYHYGSRDGSNYRGVGGYFDVVSTNTTNTSMTLSIYFDRINIFASGGTFRATTEVPSGAAGSLAQYFYTPTATPPALWVRLTRVGGTTDPSTNAGLGVWLSLSTTARVWGYATTAYHNRTGDFTVEFSTDSGGSTIVHTARIFIGARRVPL